MNATRAELFSAPISLPLARAILSAAHQEAAWGDDTYPPPGESPTPAEARSILARWERCGFDEPWGTAILDSAWLSGLPGFLLAEWCALPAPVAADLERIAEALTRERYAAHCCAALRDWLDEQEAEP